MNHLKHIHYALLLCVGTNIICMQQQPNRFSNQASYNSKSVSRPMVGQPYTRSIPPQPHRSSAFMSTSSHQNPVPRPAAALPISQIPPQQTSHVRPAAPPMISQPASPQETSHVRPAAPPMISQPASPQRDISLLIDIVQNSRPIMDQTDVHRTILPTDLYLKLFEAYITEMPDPTLLMEIVTHTYPFYNEANIHCTSLPTTVCERLIQDYMSKI